MADDRCAMTDDVGRDIVAGVAELGADAADEGFGLFDAKYGCGRGDKAGVGDFDFGACFGRWDLVPFSHIDYCNRPFYS